MSAQDARPAPLAGRTVLVRADFTQGVAPELAATAAGLARAGARVAIIAGHGEPAGEFNPALSLRGFVEPLSRATGRPVHFVAESVGLGAEAGLAAVPQGAVALMENLRFNRGRCTSRAFAMRLSALADHFVATGPQPRETDAQEAGRPHWIAVLKTLLPEPPAVSTQLEREAC